MWIEDSGSSTSALIEASSQILCDYLPTYFSPIYIYFVSIHFIYLYVQISVCLYLNLSIYPPTIYLSSIDPVSCRTLAYTEVTTFFRSISFYGLHKRISCNCYCRQRSKHYGSQKSQNFSFYFQAKFIIFHFTNYLNVFERQKGRERNLASSGSLPKAPNSQNEVKWKPRGGKSIPSPTRMTESFSHEPHLLLPRTTGSRIRTEGLLRLSHFLGGCRFLTAPSPQLASIIHSSKLYTSSCLTTSSASKVKYILKSFWYRNLKCFLFLKIIY